eukprot:6485386-Amphidinium_carterae.2
MDIVVLLDNVVFAGMGGGGQVSEPRAEHADIEGIIPDTGAIPNICGQAWLCRLRRAGAKTTSRPSSGRSLYGVGGNSPLVQECVTVWLMVLAKNDHGQQEELPITFTAEVLSQAAVPALLGLNSMSGMRGKVDSKLGQLTFKAQNGSDCKVQMLRANTGHWMVPIRPYVGQGEDTPRAAAHEL